MPQARAAFCAAMMTGRLGAPDEQLPEGPVTSLVSNFGRPELLLQLSMVKCGKAETGPVAGGSKVRESRQAVRRL